MSLLSDILTYRGAHASCGDSAVDSTQGGYERLHINHPGASHPPKERGEEALPCPLSRGWVPACAGTTG